MENKSYLHLIADLFEFLCMEWGNEKSKEEYYFDYEGYRCLKLNPKFFDDNPHTIGIKRILGHNRLIGSDGMHMAYWTHTPTEDESFDPCFLVSAEKREDPGEKLITYNLIIKVLKSYGTPGGGFSLNWIAAKQVLSIFDRLRKLYDTGHYLGKIESNSIDELRDFAVGTPKKI